MSASAETRVAVVTGAAGGIGQSLCVALARLGHPVAGVDLAPLGATGDLVTDVGGTWLPIGCDISTDDGVAAIQRAVDAELSAPTILVNNAAIDDAIGLNELTTEQWRRILAVDLHAPFMLARSFAPGMRASGWGRIINVTSTILDVPVPGFVAYKSAKMGLIGLTRALACELGPHGVTVNAVGPGVTRTPMALASLGEDYLVRESENRPIPRVAEPADVVGIMTFLISDAAAFITGQTLMPNGGSSFH